MKEKINSMFHKDSAIIYLYVALMWTILTIASNNIKLLTEDTLVLLFMKIVYALVALFGTTALLAVYMHLKKNKERIYEEDIRNGVKSK